MDTVDTTIRLAPPTSLDNPARRLVRPARLNLRRQVYLTPEQRERREAGLRAEIDAFIAKNGVTHVTPGTADGLFEPVSIGPEI